MLPTLDSERNDECIGLTICFFENINMHTYYYTDYRVIHSL